MLRYLVQGDSPILRDQYFLDQVSRVLRDAFIWGKRELQARNARPIFLQPSDGMAARLEGQNSEKHLDQEHPQTPKIRPTIVFHIIDHLIGVIAGSAGSARILAVGAG